MRKLKKLIPSVMLLMAFSCMQELGNDSITTNEEGNKIPLSLSVSSEEDATKVTFSDDNNACWENTDHIAVFDGVAKNDFVIKPETNTGSTAVFSGNVTGSYANLYTVYPYSAAVSLSGSNVNVEVPSVQTVSSTNPVDPTAIVSVGKVNNSDLSVDFMQVCGLVSFTIASSDIYKVIIEGNSLAGTATVVAETGVLSSVSSGSDKITVGYSGGGNFAPGKYYVAVLPGTTRAGDFAVSFVHEDGITHYKAVTSAVTIARKGRKGAGTVVNDNPKVRRIYNKEQLDNWGAAMGNGGGDEQYFTVYLDADIDYGSDNWPYTANDTHFNGNFKGQNHKIYNIQVESATNTSFITGLYGRFEDVIFGSSDGVNWDGKSYIKHTGNSGAIEYVGLIGEMRANNATFMTNVINFAPVSVPVGYNTRAFLGGLVGHVQSGKTVTMTNCKNYGSVSNSATWTGKETRIGGILGQCEGALLASGLENHGGLTIANNVTNFIGGLCGDLDVGSVVSGSSNYGSITFTDSGTQATYLGGCFGSVRGANITDCHNYGVITASRNAENRVGGILGNLESGVINVTACINHLGANLSAASSVAVRSFIGGIVGANRGRATTVILQDSKNEASITNNGGASDLGGIVGQFYFTSSTTSKILACVNTGAVSSSVTDGGGSVSSDLAIGGIAGNFDAGSSSTLLMQSCVNEGKISATGLLNTGKPIRMGGIVGKAYYDATIDKCKNFESVSCNNAGSNGNAYLGGILAWIDAERSDTRYQTVSNCINTGNVSSIRSVGTQNLGGIIGGGEKTVSGSINNKPVVTGCKNYGDISATRTTNTNVGGVCGYTCWRMSSCANFGNVSGGQWNGAVVGDGNANAINNSDIQVGGSVTVTGAANAGTAYSTSDSSYPTYSFTTLSNSKKWFSGGSDAAITVTIVSQETYSGSTEPEEVGTGGYLFAHTGHGEGYYYRMYYALSHDGLDWTELNNGDSPMATYYGFPYITQDALGSFWLIGVSNSTPRHPVIWKSSDMVTWTEYKNIPARVMDLPSGYENDTNSFGAMKIFSDPVSGQFMITWHAGEEGKSGDNLWESMRTFYILTSDFETFTPAQKLFAFTGSDSNVAQIDANIHYSGGKYYAVFKDERTYDTNKTYYKRPRIAVADALTGPYGNPGGDIVGGSRREAPTLVKSPLGDYWYLYTEYYSSDGNTHYYELYRSTTLTAAPWAKVDAFNPPETSSICRHGCVIPIDAKTYRRLESTY